MWWYRRGKYVNTCRVDQFDVDMWDQVPHTPTEWAGPIPPPQEGGSEMPKCDLQEPFEPLEKQIIQTLLAGHKEWRSDHDYPESYSDMQGAVRGLLRMFEVTRLPLARTLPLKE